MTGKSPKEKLVIVKIGGEVIDNAGELDAFLQNFSMIDGKKILVHGGGKVANKIGESLGIVPKMTNGRRITDQETLDLVVMVYGGMLNKKIVVMLQSLGVNSIGLTGADANVIPAVKRPVKEIDFGFVGDIDAGEINTPFITGLLNQNIVPVFSPLTWSGKSMLNTNADTIASGLAVAMQNHFEVQLIYCFEKHGVLKDLNDENSVIPLLNLSEFQKLRENGHLTGGILPKLENAFSVLQSGVDQVLIVHHQKILQNLQGENHGTSFSLS